MEWFFNDGVKLDFSSKGDGYLIHASDIEEELAHIHHVLKPGEIVLVQSGAAPLLRRYHYVRTFKVN